ncbi:jg26548, partial [Pararge aegeria aegeria]
MLRERGIQPYTLIPPSEYPLTNEEYYSLYSIYTKMDLEPFDNTDYDCRIPEEWLNLGFIEGEQYPCPGLAFIPRVEGKATKPYSDLLQMLNNSYE